MSTMTDFDKDDKYRMNRSSDDHTVDTEGSHTVDAESDIIHEVMDDDSLDMMLEIIMKIREDPDFAKNIYTECPRLQHLLDRHPDLRPIFEDPHLVRINFEQVYRKAGGVLPEDKPGFVKRTLIKVVSHPLFRVVKVLLIVKKILMCIKRIYMLTVGGGFTKIKNFAVHLFTGRSSPVGMDQAGRAMAENVDPATAAKVANQRSLLLAADHMDEPEVKEQMHRLLLSDPDALDEAIEQDPDLRALRMSDPLCAELMGDPTTMKIVVDPDNLRALGDCPDLIEADFIDPDWRPPDVEGGHFDDANNFSNILDGDRVANSSGTFVDTDGGTGPTGSAGAGVDIDGDGIVEADVDGDGNVETDINGDGNVEADGEDLVLVDEDDGGGIFEEFLDEYERGEGNAAAATNKGQARSQQNQEEDDDEAEGEQTQEPQRGGGFLSSLGAGLVNYVAMQTVGVGVSELMSGGNDFGLGALSEQAEQITAAAEERVGVLSSLEGVEDVAMSEDVTKNLEDTVNEVEAAAQVAEEEVEAEVENFALSSGGVGMAEGAAFGGALMLDGGGGGGGVTGVQARSAGATEEEEKEEEEEPKRRGIRVLRGAAGLLGNVVKEMVATSILGDDFGEALVETLNEKNEKDDNDDDVNEDNKKPGGESQNELDEDGKIRDETDNQGSKKWYE